MFGKEKKVEKMIDEALEKTGKILINVLDVKMNEIKIWNEQTFKNATLAGQLAKLEEEIKELGDAETEEEQFKEHADIFIVLAGLRRFNSLVGNYIYNTLLEEMPQGVLAGTIKAIDDKMEINRKRNWKMTEEGKYHH